MKLDVEGPLSYHVQHELSSGFWVFNYAWKPKDATNLLEVKDLFRRYRNQYPGNKFRIVSTSTITRVVMES